MLEAQLNVLSRRTKAPLVPGSNDLLKTLKRELGEYFAGTRESFTAPLATPGSELQRAVWDRLLRIPYGERITYGALASEVGRPRAVRAVARSVGDNRIAIVVPCHRVVGFDGRLTGYGGGLWRKHRLLDLEQGAASS
jgi:AraC family transcriptional regulator of adaptative response/methylated-DNA-[protein]-cysteine methyltransferase